ncbi:Efflux pump fus6 [Monascus purpureus]|uniref:Efflux pump fus6 n=1 Tax=Monascus purpureus TaxID=5098 RepID=A0A507QWW8_MONPU|nr:Efflux pump fus6 [Monascus purpureus]BDD60843.1 COP9 signalosome complex subunit 1 [Monascus purpureus]
MAEPDTTGSSPKKGWRFAVIFSALCMTAFLAALDTSIISTALPTIAAALNSETLYVWTITSYLLASTAVQPLFGQAADIFGRRYLTLLSVALFALGSGIAGGAHNTAMMIAGRTVQGIGGGGINVMVEIVVCDLVSLRERGKYVGMIGSMWAIGSVVGPIIGGAFSQHATWRWIFYINLPLSGVALALLAPFLHLHYRREGTIIDRLKRVDYLGNTILILAVISVLLALTWGGTVHAWSSWRTIVPLVLGLVGLVGFLVYEASPAVKEATMPMILFTNRTSATTYILSFLHGILLYWACYFLPVYFQAVLGASPTRSGIMLFPIATTTAPFGVMAGILITVTGHYRIFHFLGFALMAVACGLFSLLDEHSTTGDWVGFQILFGVGAGFIFTSCLPAILAALPESEVARATATWTFLRSFGSVWGTAIPSAIFNSHVNKLVASIPDAATRALLGNGGAYEHATAAFLRSYDGSPLKTDIIRVYVDSLRLIWYVSIAFAGIGFPLAFLIKGLHLRDELNTDFGMVENTDRDEKQPAVMA